MIYTSSVPSRLQYIAHLLFSEIAGLTVSFTRSKEEYLSFNGPKLAYSREDPGEGLFMESAGLLFEQQVFSHEIPVRHFHKIPILFESTNPASGFPFDLLAASFYLISRYEEYISTEQDKYGRFQASSSLAFRNGFLDKPVVNIWLKLFIERMTQIYPSLMVHQKPYRYLPTIDIDHAFAYRYRPVFRTIGGIGRSLSHGRFDEVLDRLRVLAGLSRDPFDTFSFVRSIHEQHHLSTLLFVLFADYGGNDNNIPVDGKGLPELIQSLVQWSDVGVHPSLSSSRHPSRLEQEIEGLERATGKKITRSRQHFLKFRLPDTFRQLAKLGIRDDYSMGYASHSGFRAGIAHPFCFFDLSVNETKPLRIHPVQVMDVTFRDYLQLTPEESFSEIKQIIREVRSYNGEFISLWHNESLSDTGKWKGWRSLYEEVVTEASGTRNPKPEIRNPKPETRNPKPETRNPKPETMIRYLPHNQIDKERWDRCIRESVNSLVYGFSWYLDLASPGWDALVEEDYQSVFPLTHKRKAGISYLAQPFFAQQLGIFTTDLLSQQLVTRFLDAIPAKFKLAEIHLNSFNKVDSSRFEVTPRKNHELELVYSFDEINRRYSQNTKRNIRKAMEARVEVRRKVAPDELISLFRNNFGKQEGKLNYRNYLVIEEIIAHSLKHTAGILMGAGNREGEIDAGAFFLKDRMRFILLFAASEFTTRSNGAMFLLLDTFIREHAGQPALLDFEGGNDPDLGRFYKSFGARETLYPFVRISRIPFYKQIRRM